LNEFFFEVKDFFDIIESRIFEEKEGSHRHARFFSMGRLQDDEEEGN